MKIAAWNVGQTAGGKKCRLEAAEAIVQLSPDIAVITEYCPRDLDAEFKGILNSGSLRHQVESRDPSGKANRVLIASRLPVEPIELHPPALDIYVPPAFAAAYVKELKMVVIGLRVPIWAKPEERSLVVKTWDWIEQMFPEFKSRPTVLAGDFNVTEDSGPADGGAHFRRILASGWRRATPIGSSFGLESAGKQIDHLVYSPRCRCGEAALVWRVKDFALLGEKGALSDHAVLVADVQISGH